MQAAERLDGEANHRFGLPGVGHVGIHEGSLATGCSDRSDAATSRAPTKL
jgi:hypothetical protein